MMNQLKGTFAALLLLGGLSISTSASADIVCPECDRIVVTGGVLVMALSGGLAPSFAFVNGEIFGQADTIGQDDVYEMLIMLLSRHPDRGDEDVNCSSIEPVRQAEAANQAGPLVRISNLRKAFRITYGNGQTETFILVNLTTAGFEPVPGTCS